MSAWCVMGYDLVVSGIFEARAAQTGIQKAIDCNHSTPAVQFCRQFGSILVF